MSQDVNQDWVNREFIEQVEVGIRKCVDFLNNFHESARYRISEIDQRLNSLERKLDFTQAQLANCDPSKRGAQPKPFKNSVFDSELRRQLIAKQNERREKSVNVFTDQVIAPKKSDFAKMIVGNARKPNTVPITKSSSNVSAEVNIPKEKDKEKDKEKEKEKDEINEKPIVNSNNNRPPPPSSSQAQADLARVQPQIQVPPPQQQPQPPPPKQQVNDKKEEENETPTPDQEEGGKPKFPHGKADEIDILVIEPTNGNKPEPTSKVEIEYKGFLPTGDEFISHREEILLGKRQNIRGLEMGICLMTVGSKAKLWIPSKLGYGAKGAPGLIPADTNLTFEIVLHQILPN
jgi:FKBP-type peptidyl-prolyl cis-trans isomerase